jgi:hypothetical protein
MGLDETQTIGHDQAHDRVEPCGVAAVYFNPDFGTNSGIDLKKKMAANKVRKKTAKKASKKKPANKAADKAVDKNVDWSQKAMALWNNGKFKNQSKAKYCSGLQ